MLFSCYQFVIQLKSDTNKESLGTREVLKGIDFLGTTPLNKQGKDHVLTDHKWAGVSQSTCCIHEIQKEHTSWQIRQWVIGEIWILTLGVPAASNKSLPLNAYVTFTTKQTFNFLKYRSLIWDLHKMFITSNPSSNKLVQPHKIMILNLSLLCLYQQMVDNVQPPPVSEHLII